MNLKISTSARSSLPVAVCFLAMCMLMCSASAQSPRPEKQYDVVKLADGVHAFLWKNPLENPIEGNALIIVNKDDVVLVDTGVFAETGELLAREIRKLTPLPVRYVVNTHWHDDHHGGNSAIGKHWPGAEVIGHRDTRTDIIERSYKVRPKTIAGYEKSLEKYQRWKATGKDDDGKPLDAGRKERVADLVAFLSADLPKFKGLRETPPTLTFADKMVLTRGERRIELIWLGLGNTRGDIVVFLPKERIAASGDLFVLPIPFAFFSYYEHWIDTLAKLDALEADIIVPGHGPVQRDRVALKSVRGLLEALVKEVKAAVADGATLEETKKRVTLADWKEKFAGTDKTRQAAFSSFVLAAATERLWRQARGEPDPLPSE
ncbi:MAG: MBL fold metallo-hydrolase [Betaproteobacteria bacterium]|nr:MBL fold metallo-hydrolase [Betaproteobacteria bacterium]